MSTNYSNFTQRSIHSKSGLDYSKIVLINKDNYLDNKKVAIDQDEFNAVQKNLERIAAEAVAYVEGYIGHLVGSAPLHPKEFVRKYQYSTLSYFHDLMEI
ncbi:hypothetical protein [Allobaculum sp. JKK-2023]|uniref:hypothetical protein n=1 Tax=Allobaculum sp. JKK-2023 TaxID=3108943 RepID=UPI002B060A63|nr:hypothetical protein [Allobaculum sp. JKK-2023]